MIEEIKNPLELSIILINETKSKEEKTNYTFFNKEKIFYIKKEKKSLLGRKTKNQINSNDNTHTKKKRDNIITKIKRNIYNHSLELINLLLKESKNNKIKGIELKKIDNSFIMVYKKEENLNLLNLTIKEILSSKISTKCINLTKDYNKDKISFILKQNDKYINEILNKTFREMLNIYCDNNVENNIFKDFKRLNDDILFFKNKNEDSNYIELYKTIANEFEKVINDIFPRRKRKKI